MADFTTDYMADHPVGMVYLLGDWATDCRETDVARQLGDRPLLSTMFDISPQIECPAMTVARRTFAQRQSNHEGMAL